MASVSVTCSRIEQLTALAVSGGFVPMMTNGRLPGRGRGTAGRQVAINSRRGVRAAPGRAGPTSRGAMRADPSPQPRQRKPAGSHVIRHSSLCMETFSPTAGQVTDEVVAGGRRARRRQPSPLSRPHSIYSALPCHDALL